MPDQPTPRIQPAATRPPFDRIALLLQGGGALGSYQAGVYEALAEANIHPDWVAGISIGAVNAALIAGNPAFRRVDRLREFWTTITASPFGLPQLALFDFEDVLTRGAANQLSSLSVLLGGAPGFFKPRPIPPFLLPTGNPDALSFYDLAPLQTTLERLVDFDLLNHGPMRFSAGAVNIRTGNFTYFDTTTHTIDARHVLASAALPPGFPPVEIDGEFYWDGGILSNTPLDWVLDSFPREDTLAFQVDLWSARGDMPRNLTEAELRQKDIRFSSRTRASTDQFRARQKLRRAAAKLLDSLPEALRNTPEANLLAREADEKVYNLVQLIYNSKKYESSSKDYEFSRRTMEDHWQAGLADAVRTLQHPEVLTRPTSPDGVFAFDIARPEHH